MDQTFQQWMHFKYTFFNVKGGKNWEKRNNLLKYCSFSSYGFDAQFNVPYGMTRKIRNQDDKSATIDWNNKSDETFLEKNLN